MIVCAYVYINIDEGSGEDRNETKTRRIDDGEQGSIIY